MQYERVLYARAFFLSALGQPYSLTSFGSGGGLFERLGNVYGCEGLA